MEIFKKILLIIIILVSVYCIRIVLMPSYSEKPNKPEISKPMEQKPIEENPEPKIQKETVSVYFIGQNSKKEDVYKIVKRDYDVEKDGPQLDFVINELVKGPNTVEKAQGIYSEIPVNTKIRSISNIKDKIYIDLSIDFEQGGGTDGLYKRLYQLIKTVNKNSNKDVYLKIEGREVDVIGGEGIMLSQPLNSKSLDN